MSHTLQEPTNLKKEIFQVIAVVLFLLNILSIQGSLLKQSLLYTLQKLSHTKVEFHITSE